MKKIFLLVCFLAIFTLSACQFDIVDIELPDFIENIIGNNTTDENDDDNQTEEHVHIYEKGCEQAPKCWMGRAIS